MNKIAYLQDWAVRYFHQTKFDLATSGLPWQGTALPARFDAARWLRASAHETNLALRERLAEHCGAELACVFPTLGATNGIFLLALALGRSGPVLVESPAYEPLWRSFEAFGAELRSFRRIRQERYSLGASLEQAHRLSRGCACVVVTNPHNPSGQYDSPGVIRALAEAVAPAWLVVDEVYTPFIPGAVSAWGVAQNVCIVSSLTKAYGFDFARCGWVAAPPLLAEQLERAQYYTPGLFPSAVSAVALTALEDLGAHYRVVSAHVAGRADRVDQALAESSRLAWLRPAGELIIASVELLGVEDDQRFARVFMAAHDCALAPGSFFGEPGTIRLGFGALPEQFDPALPLLLDFAEHYRE
ncbi:MAG: hypothetical protein AUK47_19935 [Deltaproteobacteria bacterium CG2_30_63_29]|nr:MAG: hypothetical protein AUK47_19935 [Deltaproteobacteria bacterium CG2_30_63_29]PJB42739.1 MAG: hypothetical protein CO108_11180 [Deltaproteobacteria bacterium CG_4_9_14_3_um_filter_63_12]